MPYSLGYGWLKARAKLRFERVFKDPYHSSPLSAPYPPVVSPQSTTENTLFETFAEGRTPQAANWMALKSLSRALSRTSDTIDSYTPFKQALSELLGLLEMYEANLNHGKSYGAFRAELGGLFEDLEYMFARDSLPMATASVMGLCRSIQQDINTARKTVKSGNSIQDFASERENSSVVECLHRIETYLQRISLNVNMQIWGVPESLVTETRLASLRPSHYPFYNSTSFEREGCAPHTRESLLASMYNWAYGDQTAPIFWMTGLAGTGKTTLLYSLCAQLEENQHLAASFFCSIALPECRDVSLILPSIAYQLARFSLPFQIVLTRALEKIPNPTHHRPLVQFETLISKPLFEVQSTLPKNLVVVIDALDECEDQGGIGQLIEVLFTKAREQPIKFIVSSRQEQGILDRVTKHEDLILWELDHSTVRLDIERYLRDSLAHMDLSVSAIHAFVERSEAFFIYAAMIVRFLKYGDFLHDPYTRLKHVLNPLVSDDQRTYRELDGLYRTILHTTLESLNPNERQEMKSVLGAVICAQAPLTISSLSGLLGLSADRVRSAIRTLLPVVHVSKADIITTFHASFPEFLLDSSRSRSYHSDFHVSNRKLTELCFDCMKEEARFNICSLESSFLFDRDVQGLEKRIEEEISTGLYYACRFWADHLSRCDYSKELAVGLENLLSSKLLHWIEILSLKGVIHDAGGIMRLAEEWTVKKSCPRELTYIVHDAWRFVTTFAANPVSQSTPHIYTSMLPFWPSKNPVSKLYATQANRLIKLEGTAMSEHSDILATWAMAGSITAISLSPDGSCVAVAIGREIQILDAYTGRFRIGNITGHADHISSLSFAPNCDQIISGSYDNTVRIWECSTGRLMSNPVRGHVYVVTSVAFSPDGVRIASGSHDKTIRVWNAVTGELSCDPLRGHSDSVTTVQFSPDSTFLVSGSYDCSVIVWDITTGSISLGPLEIASPVLAPVVFSPDGALIISASQNDVCLWDAQTGNMVGNPLKGHNRPITAIATSPDGATIASGSEDHTILLWDALTRTRLAGPLRAHTGPINFVAFFPDGHLIISSSSDNTIRIWGSPVGNTMSSSLEAHTEPINDVTMSADGGLIASCSANTVSLWDPRGEPKILKLLKGHTAFVLSVCFSPDGARLVSGSSDQTIRIWETESGIPGPVLHGHTNSVTTVTFSADGNRVISGSNDATIRIWDVKPGNKAAVPLKGHKGPVTSVAGSPDGTRLASASRDKTIKIWDVRTHQLILSIQGLSGVITTVQFSPRDQSIVSGSEDSTVRVWNTNGKTILGPLKGHTGSVAAVRFSPDGTRMISGSIDGTLCIWDVWSGGLVTGPLNGHTRAIRSVGFTPDGACVYSGSDDGTIKMTNIEGDNASVS